MTGIVSYGAYVPFHRLSRETIGSALGTRGGKGERAIASYDEDSVTMAVEAGRACLAGVPDVRPESLLFATTAPPYLEKLNAATVHAALNLAPQARAADLGCSVRAGLAGILQGLDSAAAGRNTLATMADIRVGAPEGARESAGGDAAAAFLLGASDPLAEVVSAYSETHEYLSTWRAQGQRFARSWEDRFALNQAYIPLLDKAVSALLAQAGVSAGDLAAVVLDAPNPRAAAAVAKRQSFSPEQLVDALALQMGHIGAAHAGLLLASALDRAHAGDLILLVSVSDGVDGLLLRATDRLEAGRPARTVTSWLDSKRGDLNYLRYLKWRGLLETEPPRRPDPERPAAPPSFRSEQWKFSFIGSRCSACGTAQLPPQIVCVSCQAVGKMEPVAFADETAKIRTFTVDRLAFTPQPPMVVAVIDFDCGGRFESELTDCEPEKVAIGDRVEMTFRRLYTADGVHNYFWKARPAR